MDNVSDMLYTFQNIDMSYKGGSPRQINSSLPCNSDVLEGQSHSDIEPTFSQLPPYTIVPEY